MASQSAHFNLTKPATTDNYNIAVFNANTDLIDTQMYNNQQSAAKEMVGATASADGESGRVPAPTSSDKDKYLKGDGTWDTPSGGGGGSTVSITPTLATGIKIAEYEIDGVGGDIYAPNGGGGSSIVSLSAAQYDALSEAQKKNGTVYLVGSSTEVTQLIERVSSSSDSRVISSQLGGSYPAWQAFNGVATTSLRNPDNSWGANEYTANEYIGYHLDSAKYLSKMSLNCYSNYSGNWIGNVKVEGSNDGTNWSNILASGESSEEITVYLAPTSEGGIGSETTIDIELDSSTAYEYVRFVGIDPLIHSYYPSCFIDEIYVYGASTPIVLEDCDIYYMDNRYTKGNDVTDVTDLDFTNLTPTQTSDIVDKINGSSQDSGSFTTGANQYDKVEINCGFRPDYIQVLLPFSQSDTVSTYDSDVSTTTSTWYIPQESRTYTIALGETQGETGISDITDTGFKFRCNASNTRSKQCTYIASKYGSGTAYTETVLFTGGTSSDTSFTLSDTLTHYNTINIYYKHNDGNDDYIDVKSYPSTLLHSLSGTSANVLGLCNDIWYYYFTVTDDTHLAYSKSNAGYISDIIGITC